MGRRARAWVFHRRGTEETERPVGWVERSKTHAGLFGAISLTSLQPGRHTIEARVRWPDGTVIAERETFTIEAI
ncbi:MAG: hypothetical protein A2V98_23590 [Planctomycetes bacterium RBG_16_64_12]|nr:MAG: hypothetical protein A2V98_23590 [Planctomycetes bacterium RBG_16_64_12]